MQSGVVWRIRDGNRRITGRVQSPTSSHASWQSHDCYGIVRILAICAHRTPACVCCRRTDWRWPRGRDCPTYLATPVASRRDCRDRCCMSARRDPRAPAVHVRARCQVFRELVVESGEPSARVNPAIVFGSAWHAPHVSGTRLGTASTADLSRGDSVDAMATQHDGARSSCFRATSGRAGCRYTSPIGRSAARG